MRSSTTATISPSRSPKRSGCGGRRACCRRAYGSACCGSSTSAEPVAPAGRAPENDSALASKTPRPIARATTSAASEPSSDTLKIGSASGRAPVAPTNTMSPSSGVCTGRSARAMPSCAMMASALRLRLGQRRVGRDHDQRGVLAGLALGLEREVLRRHGGRQAAPAEFVVALVRRRPEMRPAADHGAARRIDHGQRADRDAVRASAPRPSRCRPSGPRWWRPGRRRRCRARSRWRRRRWPHSRARDRADSGPSSCRRRSADRTGSPPARSARGPRAPGSRGPVRGARPGRRRRRRARTPSRRPARWRRSARPSRPDRAARSRGCPARRRAGRPPRPRAGRTARRSRPSRAWHRRHGRRGRRRHR